MLLQAAFKQSHSRDLSKFAQNTRSAAGVCQPPRPPPSTTWALINTVETAPVQVDDLLTGSFFGHSGFGRQPYRYCLTSHATADDQQMTRGAA